MHNPGQVPTPAAAARLLASQALVAEVFARLDAGDVDGAVALYADDAVFLGAVGRAAIKDTMVRGTARHAGRSRHVIANLRAELDGDTTVVEYTAVAYTLDGPGPYAPRSVYDQVQHHRPGPGGALRVVRHEIFGLDPAALA
ncbi:MAG TPA: nuclear transport factor 2 family protein [Acidimicrobiales bacterium]